MNTHCYPTICYSEFPEKRILMELELTCPSRPIIRYDDKFKRLVQRRMTLLILNKEDKERLDAKGLFTKSDKGKKRPIELGLYHIRDKAKPNDQQTSNLYFRFDKHGKYTHCEIYNFLTTWLLELQDIGMLSHYTLQIPASDREGEGKHKGYAYLHFSDNQEIDERCVTFAMLQNRPFKATDLSNVLSVVWSKKRDENEETE